MVYRDILVPCLSCRAPLVSDGAVDEGDRLACMSCGGRLVAYALLGKTHPRLVELFGQRPAPRPQRPRECPRCNDGMRQLELFGVTVDLCDVHGAWFDSQEAETLARRAEEDLGV